MDDRISRACHEWYHEAKQLHNLLAPSSRTGSNTNAYESLIYGMISTLFQASSELPKSFQYDLKRLERIRSDMQDLVNLKMCLRVFDDLHSCIMSERPAFLSSDAHAELQWRILALVDEQGDDEDPWQMSSADVALEITRAACISSRQPAVPLPDWLIQNVHIRLGELISGQTPEFAFIWDTLQKELAVEAVRYAQVFNSMTPLTMSEAQQQWQQRRAQKNISRPLPDMEDIARRLAHVGILHWKVWASLVYLDDIEQASTELPALISPRTETPAGDSTEVLSDVSSSVEMMVE